MRRTSLAWIDRPAYLAARCAAMGLTTLGIEASLRAAAAVGRQWFRLDKRHRLRAIDHVRRAFPDWPTSEVESLARQSFEYLAKLAVEVLNTPRLITRCNYETHLSRTNATEALTMLGEGRPAILVTGHFGSFEALAYMLALEGHTVHAVARPLDNRLINDWLLGMRRRSGLRIIEKWDQANHRITEALRSGGAVGFVADQSGGPHGLYVPFFGRLASTHKAVGLFATQMNVPVICGYARRIDGSALRYELGVADIIYPDDWTSQPDALYYVTARTSHALETIARRYPEQYLWMHRRWKWRPRFEREGNPMPKSLRQKLEQLPWLDQAAMDQLTAIRAPAVD